MRRECFTALLLALALLTGCAPAAGEGEPSPSPTGPVVTHSAPVETPAVSELLESPKEPDPTEEPGDIWLYGEAHGHKDILEEELRLWKEAYDRGVRHLFVEKPYYTAEYLNLWMAAEQVYVIDYTAADGTVERHFYRSDGNTWQGMAATEEFLPPE